MFHEIGYIILGGALSCWPHTPPDCKSKGMTIEVYKTPKQKPSEKIQVTSSDIKSFSSKEVEYEVEGIPVYEKKGHEWFKLKKEDGSEFWLNLNQLKEKFSNPSLKNKEVFPEEEINFKSIETFLIEGLIYIESSNQEEFRSEDLKTKLPKSPDTVDSLKEKSIQEWIAKNKYEFPASKLIIELDPIPFLRPDVSQESNYIIKDVFENPNVLNKIGSHILNNKNFESFENNLAIFETKDDWARVMLFTGEKTKRPAWINLKQIPKYELKSLTESEQRKYILKTLVEKDDRNQYFLATAMHYDIRERIDLKPTGKHKIVEGILWIEVHVYNISPCEAAEPMTLFTAWLPYKKAKEKEPIIKWYSRGC